MSPWSTWPMSALLFLNQQCFAARMIRALITTSWEKICRLEKTFSWSRGTNGIISCKTTQVQSSQFIISGGSMRRWVWVSELFLMWPITNSKYPSYFLVVQIGLSRLFYTLSISPRRKLGLTSRIVWQRFLRTKKVTWFCLTYPAVVELRQADSGAAL